MKTNAMSQIYAFAMSAVFATVATVGVAAMMASSGEHARAEFNASAAAQADAQPAATNLTLWQGPAVQAKRVM